MIWIRLFGATVGGALVASLVSGAVHAAGNAIVVWWGWGLIAPFVGALCGCVVVVWAAPWHRRHARPAPRRVPVLRNPPMSAQGLRLLSEVSAATIRAQRSPGRTCRYCHSGRLVARGPVQASHVEGGWRRWRCADCGGEMDYPEAAPA